MNKLQTLFIIPIFLLSLGTAFSQTNCRNYSEDYIPKNLNDALIYLECEWSQEDKNEFKNKDEQDAVTQLHFGTGLSIRNSWGLWAEKENSFKRYFKRLGIFHPDDISSIILTSFHRKLNGKDIDLNEQVKYYKEYWERVRIENEAEREKQTLESKREFESFEIGDSVKIAFKMHKNRANWAYRIQKYPDLNEEPNCYVSGVVMGKKKKSRKKGKYLLEIKITDMCGYDNAIMGSREGVRLKIGEEYDFFSLMDFKITKN